MIELEEEKEEKEANIQTINLFPVPSDSEAEKEISEASIPTLDLAKISMPNDLEDAIEKFGGEYTAKCITFKRMHPERTDEEASM